MRAYKRLSFVFFKEKQEEYKNKQKRFVAGGREGLKDVLIKEREEKEKYYIKFTFFFFSSINTNKYFEGVTVFQ